MLRTNFVVNDPAGLHAQSAALICSTISEFECDVTLHSRGTSCNARSVFEIIALGAEQGTSVSVLCEGADASECIQALLPVLREL